MKKIICILLLIPFIVNSQNEKVEFLNFKLLDDKTLIWQEVFETEKSLDELKVYFQDNSFTSNLILKDSTFIGRSGKTKLSKLKGAAIAAYQNFDVFVKVQYKKGKYRVSITDLQFDPTEVMVTSGGFGIGQSTSYRLEDLAVRKNHHEIRKNNNNKTFLTTLNNDFIKLFTVKVSKDADENW